MKILHFGTQLPDGRIERAASLGKKLRHKCYFLGNSSTGLALENHNLFEEIKTIEIKPRHNVGINTKKLLNDISVSIKEIDPDIIHAHDVYNAYKIHKLFPSKLVYDAHELWSLQVKFNKKLSLVNIIKSPKSSYIDLRTKVLFPKWEKKLIRTHPTITVSNPIKNNFTNRQGKNIFVIPNMPLKNEVADIEYFKPPKNQLVSSFLGSDIAKSHNIVYRDTAGLIDIFLEGNIGKLLVIGDDKLESNEYIESTGRISHLKCIPLLSKAHVGLFGFKSHIVHSISSPNKAHFYAHAGNIPFLSDLLYNNLTYMQEISYKYDNFIDLKHKLLKNKKDLIDNSGSNIREWALKNIILDNYKNVLKEAYNSI